MPTGRKRGISQYVSFWVASLCILTCVPKPPCGQVGSHGLYTPVQVLINCKESPFLLSIFWAAGNAEKRFSQLARLSWPLENLLCLWLVVDARTSVGKCSRSTAALPDDPKIPRMTHPGTSFQNLCAELVPYNDSSHNGAKLAWWRRCPSHIAPLR